MNKYQYMKVYVFHDVIMNDCEKEEEHIEYCERESAHDVTSGDEELFSSDKRKIRKSKINRCWNQFYSQLFY